MSNFTYEIDERNLRLKMRDFTVSFDEKAWHKFEALSEVTVLQQRENRNGFQFTLNRNVVLPSVFGVIIILFSFLLVNFVNIKNPAKESAAQVEVQTPAALATQPAATIEKASPAKATGIKQQKAEPAIVSAPAIAEQEAPVTTASQESKHEASPAEQQVAATNDSSQEDATAEARRRAERRAARAEAKKLEEIRPLPVAEEHDVEEVRPD